MKTGKNREQRAQPGTDRPSCDRRVASDVPCRKLHTLHIRAEESASEEEEAPFQEEDEEREAEEGSSSSWRVDFLLLSLVGMRSF